MRWRGEGRGRRGESRPISCVREGERRQKGLCDWRGWGGCRVGRDAAAEMVINWLSVTLTAKERRGGKDGRRKNAWELSPPGFSGWHGRGRTL